MQRPKYSRSRSRRLRKKLFVGEFTKFYFTCKLVIHAMTERDLDSSIDAIIEYAENHELSVYSFTEGSIPGTEYNTSVIIVNECGKFGLDEGARLKFIDFINARTELQLVSYSSILNEHYSDQLEDRYEN